MKKIFFLILLVIFAYFASPWSGWLRFFEKRGANVINDYLYNLSDNWKEWLLSFSWFLYSNIDEDFLTGYKDSLLNSHVLLLQSYEISDPGILKTFKNAVDSGTNLRILTESSRPYQWINAFKELKTYFQGTMAQIRSDEHLSTQYLHDNFIITSSGFWIQTADLSTDWLTKNRDYFLFSDNPQIMTSLRYIFERDWIGDEIDADRIEPNLVVCNLNCRAIITDLITNAKESIVLQMEDISDPSIYALLSEKPSEIVYKENDYWRIVTWDFEFKAIFPNSKDNKLIADVFWTWNVRLLKKTNSHTKMMVIDHKWLLIWSMNFNHESLDTNREIWLLIDDPTVIERFLSWFNEDWRSMDRYYCPYGWCDEGASLDFLNKTKKWEKRWWFWDVFY